MNSLFTETEKKIIYSSSLWMNEHPYDTALLDKDENYALFSLRFDSLCTLFNPDCPGRESYEVFSGDIPLIEYAVDRIFFVPFLAFFKKNICEAFDFNTAAFSEWDSSFVDSLQQIFGLSGFDMLVKTAGEITGSTVDWEKAAAIPCIVTGKHFRAMALAYPVFARQIMEFTFLQIAHCREILYSLKEELPKRYSFFFPGEIKGHMPEITRVSASASDRHNGGKCVHIIYFENGNRLVYKPHDMAIDRAFAKWLNIHALKAGLTAYHMPKSADTKYGGFCEFYESFPLSKKEDAAIFFERAGFLFGIVYMLRGCDLHAENIMANGCEPVIIDIETVVCPPAGLTERLKSIKLPYNVNRMLILPTLKPLPGFSEVPWCGLCHMPKGCSNLPVWQGIPLSGSLYPLEISKGFKKALLTICNDMEDSRKTFLEAFKGCNVRMVIKPTSSYVTVLNSLGRRYYQENINEYRNLIHYFSETGTHVSEADKRLITKTEAEAFDRLDVAYFTEELNEEMCLAITNEWDSVSEKTAEIESARIVFCLDRHAPSYGSPFAEDNMLQPSPYKASPKQNDLNAFGNDNTRSVLFSDASPAAESTEACHNDNTQLSLFSEASPAADGIEACLNDNIYVQQTGSEYGLYAKFPDKSINTAPINKSLINAIEKNMHDMAARLALLADRRLSPLIVTDRQDSYLVADSLSGCFCHLDAGLGVLAALGAYLKIYDDEAIREIILPKINMLTDSFRCASCLTAGTLGLADGAAGYILGCFLCHETDLLTDNEFTDILDMTGDKLNDERKLRFSHAGILYGSCDIVYAICRLPEKYKTEGLKKILTAVMSGLQESSLYSDLSENEISALVQKEMIKAPRCGNIYPPQNNTPAPGIPSALAGQASGMASAFTGQASGKAYVFRNETLRFGNAGILYRCAEPYPGEKLHITNTNDISGHICPSDIYKMCSAENPDELCFAKNPDKLCFAKNPDELCMHLSEVKHVLEGIQVPPDCLESGLFHGLPGVMYSICRYLRPDVIPCL